MKLCETTLGNAYIYDIQAKKEKLKSFKEQVLSLYRNENMLYEMTSYSKNNLEMVARDINNSEPYDMEYGEYGVVLKKKPKDKKLQESLLDNYINGEYEENLPYMVYSTIDDLNFYHKEPRNYLLNTEEVKYFNDKKFKLDNIISLPRTLYFLQLLETGKYKEIVDEKEIETLLNLFYVKDIEKINFRTLDSLEELGALDIEVLDERSKTDEKILQKAIDNHIWTY